MVMPSKKKKYQTDIHCAYSNIPQSTTFTNADMITIQHKDYNELARFTEELSMLELEVKKYDKINKKN
jgi:hypothetical protein